jgi:hypothetical protein
LAEEHIYSYVSKADPGGLFPWETATKALFCLADGGIWSPQGQVLTQKMGSQGISELGFAAARLAEEDNDLRFAALAQAVVYPGSEILKSLVLIDIEWRKGVEGDEGSSGNGDKR